MSYKFFYENFIRSYWEDDKGLRVGQFFINELSKHNLELYRKVPAYLDCFYDDKLFGVCSDWVQDRWEDT